MRGLWRLTITAILLVSAASMATAQVNTRSGGARIKNPPNTTSDPYGERPYDPNIGVPCSQRPFAAGCDKRGFW